MNYYKMTELVFNSLNLTLTQNIPKYNAQKALVAVELTYEIDAEPITKDQFDNW